MDLLEFLTENPVDDLKQDVVVSSRMPTSFTIKAMTTKEYKEYQARCTIKRKGNVTVDTPGMELLMVINHTTNPNFSNAEAIKKAGCITPVEFVQKVLKPGEFDTLVAEIIKLSGFDSDINKDIETAKN